MITIVRDFPSELRPTRRVKHQKYRKAGFSPKKNPEAESTVNPWLFFTVNPWLFFSSQTWYQLHLMTVFFLVHQKILPSIECQTIETCGCEYDNIMSLELGDVLNRMMYSMFGENFFGLINLLLPLLTELFIYLVVLPIWWPFSGAT